MIRKLKNIYHLSIAILAMLWFRNPSKKLIVIGVTGTDGKTTTVNLIYHILHHAGKRTSMISTVGAVLNGEKYNIGFHVTTPSAWLLQKLLQKAVVGDHDEKRYMVVEVSSHALDQFRVYGLPFSIGVLTNITKEHLDYHGTYENYVKTKVKLLQTAQTAIVNKDDMSYEKVIRLLKQRNKEYITYGIQEGANITPDIFPFKTRLFGEFNRYNVLAAIAVCKKLGISDQEIREGIASYTAPEGRQDIIFDKGFSVMIDFAHTPNSFKMILPEVRKLTKGRLIHVFGAAAKRDAFKRPLMGEEAAKYADVIILTAEDPRDEPVEKIMEEIASGFKNSKFEYRGSKQIQNKNVRNCYFMIPDRKEAIQFAVQLAQEGDTVLLTGKGHEKSMNYGHGEEFWDEYYVAKEAIKKKNKNAETK